MPDVISPLTLLMSRTITDQVLYLLLIDMMAQMKTWRGLEQRMSGRPSSRSDLHPRIEAFTRISLDFYSI
jgi:hypothetical protein